MQQDVRIVHHSWINWGKYDIYIVTKQIGDKK